MLEKYFEAITTEAHDMNNEAINNLKSLKDFNQKSQDTLLTISTRINVMHRKIGEFTN